MGNITSAASSALGFHPSTVTLCFLGGYTAVGVGTGIYVFFDEINSFPTRGKGPDFIEGFVILALVPFVILYSLGCGILWPYALPKRLLRKVRGKNKQN